jgi:hypothetical protein
MQAGNKQAKNVLDKLKGLMWCCATAVSLAAITPWTHNARGVWISQISHKKNNKIGKNIPQSDLVEWQLFTSLNYINQQVNVNSLKSSSFNS